MTPEESKQARGMANPETRKKALAARYPDVVHLGHFRMTQRKIDRMLALIERAPGCWPWRGFMGRQGYGLVAIWLGTGRASTIMAHRFSYLYHVGPIPQGLLIRHTCDNPPCCNPKHLIPGTLQDNADDKVLRNRAGLSTDTIRTILCRLAGGETASAIARDIGVNNSTVSRIKTGTRHHLLLQEMVK